MLNKNKYPQGKQQYAGQGVPGGIGQFNPNVQMQRDVNRALNSSSAQAQATTNASRPRSQLGHISNHYL